LNGITNYTWTNWSGPDVLFRGGAEQFIPGPGSFQGKNYYIEFASKGYNVAYNNTQLQATSNSVKTLGIFSISNMAKWLDRNVYTANLRNQSNAPDGSKGDATDQPGLKEMTLKAIDILQTRNLDNGWFIMSEAASIDKQMHMLDYDRALGELLELDDTVKASIAHLNATGQLADTLIIVTADHGHSFDVMGSVDTKYLNAQTADRQKPDAIGTYRTLACPNAPSPTNPPRTATSSTPTESTSQPTGIPATRSSQPSEQTRTAGRTTRYTKTAQDCQPSISLGSRLPITSWTIRMRRLDSLSMARCLWTMAKVCIH
jgi:alkaline phosphatase